MKNASNKTAIAIALFLILTIAVTIIALPAANAHTPAWEVPTYAYINAAPNPIGVDETAIVVFWLDKVPPGAAGIAGERWIGWTLEVTKPDETKETISLGISDPVGGGWISYTPDQLGTYTFKLNFPGQVITGSTGSGIYSYNIAINDTYLASSATTTLTVQEEPIPDPPSYPLPTEYWTRPIEGHNTDWAGVASNWVGVAGASNPPNVVQLDGAAPNSPHIMWTRPLSDGGVAGGNYSAADGMTYYAGLMYEGKMSTSMIINGRLYYNLPLGSSTPGMFGGASAGGGYVCVDLRTGEQLWWLDEPIPTFGQLFDYESMNQHGVIPNGYLWRSVTDASNGGRVWMAYDPLDGKWLFNETNVPTESGFMTPVQTVFGPNGEILIYNLDIANNWLACWNNTAAHGLTGATSPTDTTSSSFYQWRPIGKNVNASDAYSWNVTIPTLPAGSSIITSIYDDLMLGSSGSLGGVGATNSYYTLWAISLKPSSRGQLLWMEDYTLPAGNVTQNWGVVDPVSRVFTLSQKETMTWCGYDLDTGKKLWGPTDPATDFDFYGTISNMMRASTAYGRMYYAGHGGILYCYNLETGDLLWTYGNGGEGNTTNSGLNTAYGLYPLIIGAIADGKIYMTTTEHSPNAPPIKGAEVRCVNATDGTEIWTMLGWANQGMDGTWAIADGYMVYLNLYDMQVYCIGKGPSATTVSIQNDVITHGKSVLVKGTVIDTAAGTKQNEQAARFPNGVPVVSDESQSDWMEYVYMQKPKPTDVTGVEVVIEVLDPNNNYYEVGRTTTDASGMFKLMFTPEVPGEYTIIATFEGSESYYGSYAETAIGVEEGVAPTPTPTPTPASMADLYFLPMSIGIIIAIIAVGALLFLLLRKR